MSPFRKATLTALVLLIGMLTGCATVLQNLPAPPEFVSTLPLDGPYDKQIPDKLRGQLRGASLVTDWAVPYLFMNVGLHFEGQGDDVRALHFFDRAIAEFRKRNNGPGEGTAFNRRVFSLYAFGRIQEAFGAIREKEKSWNAAPMQAFVEYNYGHYFLMNGDYAKALGHYETALRLLAAAKDDYDLLILKRDAEFGAGVATILADYVPRMSRMFGSLAFTPEILTAMRAHTNEGIAHLNAALKLQDDIRGTKAGPFTPEEVFRIMEANIRNFLGLANGILGDYKKAHAGLDRSAEIARMALYRTGEVDALFFRNQVLLFEGDITAGRKAAEQLNALADSYRFPFYQVWAKYILARYAEGYGEAGRAIATLRQAMEIIEDQRSRLAVDVLKETYLFNRQVVYEALIQLLAREGDAAGALEVAERAKARVLVDLLAARDMDMGNPGEEKTLLAEEGQRRDEIAGLNRRLIQVRQENEEQDLRRKLGEAKEKHRGVIVKLRAVNEELSSLVSVRAPEYAELRKLLDDQTALIDYFVTDKRLYAWAIQEDRIHLEQIPLEQTALRSLVETFQQAILTKDGPKTEALSRQIHDAILRPVLPFVSAKRVGIIPHDVLYYLSFAALRDGEQRYLAESRMLFQLPGAGVLKFVLEKGKGAGWNILALGNPDLGDKAMDLPYAAAEVEKIREMIPETTVYTGKEATLARVREGIGRADMVHFATHGQYVPDNPMASSLLLTPAGDDGRLTVPEIFKLRFRGRGVVLSACQTALGASATGTEIVGLTRSFLYAGSPSVVSTLWNVDDQATAAFMEFFYSRLREGRSMSESLQAAQGRMIGQGAAPFYWAPFVLTGRY